MEDWKFGLLISAVTVGLGGIASAITWFGKRIAKAFDNSGETTVKAIDRNTAAMINNTESNAVLSTKIDSIAKFVRHATPPKGTKINDE